MTICFFLLLWASVQTGFVDCIVVLVCVGWWSLADEIWWTYVVNQFATQEAEVDEVLCHRWIQGTEGTATSFEKAATWYVKLWCFADVTCNVWSLFESLVDQKRKIHTRQDYDERRAPSPQAVFQTCLLATIVLGWRVENCISGLLTSSLQLLILDARTPFAARCPCASPRSRVHGILFNEASAEVGFLWKCLFFDQHSLRSCKVSVFGILDDGAALQTHSQLLFVWMISVRDCRFKWWSSCSSVTM